MEHKLYHILNRGVEKRKIFLSEKDYLRFFHNLNDFNDLNASLSYNDRRYLALREPSKSNKKRRSKKEIIAVLCWCLMYNHFHILVLEKINKGVSIYSQKLTSGHTQYFNRKNDRTGVLFQGRSKIILVKNNPHFLWLPFYIMANPLEMFQKDWKIKGIQNPNKAFKFLMTYKWSSLADLTDGNGKNFPKMTNKKLFYEIYDTNEDKFKKDFLEWLKNYKGGYDFGGYFND